MFKKIIALALATSSFVSCSVYANGSEMVGKIQDISISQEAVTFTVDTRVGYQKRIRRCNKANDLTFVIYMSGDTYSEMVASFLMDSYRNHRVVKVYGNGDCYSDPKYQQETVKEIAEA